jgi:hypothetical protein
MGELVNDALAPARFSLLLMEGLGSLALFLALIGVYGVISFSVAQRTREFGVRMALGQAPGELRRAVVAQALKVILPSIGLGVVAAALSTRFLDGLLYGVHPLDPVTFTYRAAWADRRRDACVRRARLAGRRVSIPLLLCATSDGAVTRDNIRLTRSEGTTERVTRSNCDAAIPAPTLGHGFGGYGLILRI